MNGLDVFLFEHGRIGILFGLCIILQIYSCRYETYFLAMFMQILFGVLLIVFPLSVWPFKYLGFDFIAFYGIGFYISLLCILINIILNVRKMIEHRRKERLL